MPIDKIELERVDRNILANHIIVILKLRSPSNDSMIDPRVAIKLLNPLLRCFSSVDNVVQRVTCSRSDPGGF